MAKPSPEIRTESPRIDAQAKLKKLFLVCVQKRADSLCLPSRRKRHLQTFSVDLPRDLAIEKGGETKQESPQKIGGKFGTKILKIRELSFGNFSQRFLPRPKQIRYMFSWGCRGMFWRISVCVVLFHTSKWNLSNTQTFVCVLLKFASEFTASTIGGSQKGGFQKGGFGGCSPGTKTGTRVRSPKPPFYETALLSPSETKKNLRLKIRCPGLLRDVLEILFMCYLSFSTHSKWAESSTQTRFFSPFPSDISHENWGDSRK